MKEAIDTMEIKPHVVQVEAHPYFPQHELKKLLAQTGMGLMAWYPLGHGDKALIGEHEFHIRDNFDIFDLSWDVQERKI